MRHNEGRDVPVGGRKASDVAQHMRTTRATTMRGCGLAWPPKPQIKCLGSLNCKTSNFLWLRRTKPAGAKSLEWHRVQTICSGVGPPQAPRVAGFPVQGTTQSHFTLLLRYPGRIWPVLEGNQEQREQPPQQVAANSGRNRRCKWSRSVRNHHYRPDARHPPRRLHSGHKGQ